MAKFVAGTVAALVAAFLLAPVEVSAVVKSFQVLQNGEPVANTTVTLTAPSGQTYEEETDDDGKIIGFDFNEDGDWRVAWPGGVMTISAAGGAAQWVVPAILGVGAILILSTSGSDSFSAPPASGPPPPQPSLISGQYGMFTFNQTSNPDNHFQFFTLCNYDVVESGGSLTIDCDASPLISFTATGTVDGSNNFTATGMGTYDNNPMTEIQMDGSFDTTGLTWEGSASAGTNDSLPDINMDGVNDPISGDFTGPMF